MPIPLAVIGGGPAGLRAAECAASAGIAVTLFDAKPSVGRKFLVAGKGGLNLTHGEEFQAFTRRYTSPDAPENPWPALLAEFPPQSLRDWAAALGVETFQASSGRVYPKALKAAPLLRRWIARLKALGVRFEMNHPWTGLDPGRPHRLHFANGTTADATAVVFALGGGSWPQTGSTATWLPVFEALGIPCSSLEPANCGWETPWPPEFLATCEGAPLKNLTVTAAGTTVAGELLITRYGLEGGTIYQLGPVLRGMRSPAIAIDFKPTFTEAGLLSKMESVKHGFLAAARSRWRLSDAAHALISLQAVDDLPTLLQRVKHCVVPLTRPRPLEEAISSAGGVRWSALDSNLMIQKLPGLFVAGEMIDWEAPTGGYLMQGCFATGTRAGFAAANHIRNASSPFPSASYSLPQVPKLPP